MAQQYRVMGHYTPSLYRQFQGYPFMNMSHSYPNHSQNMPGIANYLPTMPFGNGGGQYPMFPTSNMGNNPNFNMMELFPYPNNQNVQVQTLFENPLHPIYQNNEAANFNEPPHPYPYLQQIPPRPKGVEVLLNSFKGQDGNIDLNKMFSTAGQLMGAVNQFSGLIKGIANVFKA